MYTCQISSPYIKYCCSGTIFKIAHIPEFQHKSVTNKPPNTVKTSSSRSQLIPCGISLSYLLRFKRYRIIFTEKSLSPTVRLYELPKLLKQLSQFLFDRSKYIKQMGSKSLIFDLCFRYTYVCS